MICRWAENPNSDALKRHIPRIHDYLWIAEDGMKTKVLCFIPTILVVSCICPRSPFSLLLEWINQILNNWHVIGRLIINCSKLIKSHLNTTLYDRTNLMFL